MTGKSSSEIVAEAVGTIGPYMTWIAHKRAEIQGQIAQMQVAATAGATTDSPLTARLRGVALPTTGNLPTSEGEPHIDTTVTMPPTDSALPQADPRSTPAPEGDPDARSGAADTPLAVTQSADTTPPVEEPVRSQASTSSAISATASVVSLPTLQNQEEAQAYLETVFAATPPHTLPPRVLTAWEGRTADAKYNARMLIGAKEAGVLSEELAHAVSAMIAFDSEFAEVYALYPEGLYKELFDIGPEEHGPKDDEEDQAELAEDGDTEEGEGDEEEAETEQQWGFPGEDTHERPF